MGVRRARREGHWPWGLSCGGGRKTDILESETGNGKRTCPVCVPGGAASPSRGRRRSRPAAEAGWPGWVQGLQYILDGKGLGQGAVQGLGSGVLSEALGQRPSEGQAGWTGGRSTERAPPLLLRAPPLCGFLAGSSLFLSSSLLPVSVSEFCLSIRTAVTLSESYAADLIFT